MEVVLNATFTTTLQLTNFELWQLGLIGCVLYDLGEGLVPIGSGKSRGLGQVKGIVHAVDICFAASLAQPVTPTLLGLASLERQEDCQTYGYWQKEKEELALEAATVTPDPLGVRTKYRLSTPAAVLRLWEKVAPLATTYLAQYEVPPTMRLGSEGKR
jgi:hypothetical protein